MELKFNLLDQPWLPCIDNHNQPLDLSLLDAITHAHTLQDVQSDLSITTGALKLFLLAFVSAIFKPADSDAWHALWQQGAFLPELVASYAHTWRDRFDLFDPYHPFYQDPKMGLRDKDLINLKQEQNPIPRGFNAFLLHRSSGANATLFDHTTNSQALALQPAEAARILLMLQAYGLGGMGAASIGNDKYYKDSPFSRGILFLNRGENLFETLMLNLVPAESNIYTTNGVELPSWERDDPLADESLEPNGILDILTWQSRRILLLPEIKASEIFVSNAYFAPGLGLPKSYQNPYYHTTHIVQGSKVTFRPLRFQISRVNWRDSATILETQTENVDVPLSVRLYKSLRADGVLVRNNIHLDLYGSCTEPGKKKLYFYGNEHFVFPVAYLENPDLLSELHQGLEWAESIRTALYYATSDLASFKISPNQDVNNQLKPDRKNVSALYAHVNMEPRFWSLVEQAFYHYLFSLPGNPDAHLDWQKALVKAARQSFASAEALIGKDAAGLKASAKGKSKLEMMIYQTFNSK